MIVAIYYSHMLRHFGALPIVDHAIDPEDVNLPGRATLQATVDFIIGLLNDAINCPDFHGEYQIMIWQTGMVA